MKKYETKIMRCELSFLDQLAADDQEKVDSLMEKGWYVKQIAIEPATSVHSARVVMLLERRHIEHPKK